MIDSEAHFPDSMKDWRAGSSITLVNTSTSPTKKPNKEISLPHLRPPHRHERRNSASGLLKQEEFAEEQESFSDNGAILNRAQEDSAAPTVETPRSRLGRFTASVCSSQPTSDNLSSLCCLFILFFPPLPHCVCMYMCVSLYLCMRVNSNLIWQRQRTEWLRK